MELLRINNLRKTFPKNRVAAIDGVDFSVLKGEILGLVGESGCGKTTLSKVMLRLIAPDAGSVFYKDKDILKIPAGEMLELRKHMQIIFQDPYSSLDPRMKIGDIIDEVYSIHYSYSKEEASRKKIGLLESVGLGESYLNRLPSQLSGGERQRVGIARALATEPEFIICDEPVSSLDISIQAQILNLLLNLQKEKNLTYLFISHDLGVIGSLCDRVAVMKDGRLVELGACEEVFRDPKNEYTKALLKSIGGGK
ncbi:MAG: ABC transporter ATP-binding protein [Candidatus Omnitrophota bacterium]